MNQRELLLQALRERGDIGITPKAALLEVGSFRLAARILELRRAGYDIENVGYTTESGAHVACYVLHEKPKQLDWDEFLGKFA